MSEKSQMGGFFLHDKLENHTSEEKGKREENDRRRRGKTNVPLFAFTLALILENCLTEKVYLAVTFSKLQLDIYMHPLLLCRKRFCRGNKS